MKNKLLSLTLLSLLVLPTLLACSKAKEDAVTESKGAIKQMTDQVADQAVEKIKGPLEKAKEMANKGEEHLNKIDEELKKGHQ